MNDLKRILVAVDFSACTAPALESALFLAGLGGATIDALHAWQVPDYVTPELVSVEDQGSPVLLGVFARRQAERRLAEAVRPFRARGVEIRERAEFGHPAPVILEAAVELKSDLVIVGMHGRSALGHVIFGSVAQHVVRGASAPVLVVHAPPAP